MGEDLAAGRARVAAPPGRHRLSPPNPPRRSTGHAPAAGAAVRATGWARFLRPERIEPLVRKDFKSSHDPPGHAGGPRLGAVVEVRPASSDGTPEREGDEE